MKIVICWTHLSGYISACFRELARRPGVDLHVLLWSAATGEDIAFKDSLTESFSCTLLKPDQRQDAAYVRDAVVRQAPDALMLPGWVQKTYMRLAYEPALDRAAKLMAMDTPWRDDLRQRLAPWRLWRYLKRMSGVLVPGERAFQYAIRLGFKDGQVSRMLYGFDAQTMLPAMEQRLALPGGWPRRFLYMGRYVPEKSIDVMLDAYAAYRGAVSEPWELLCHGDGPLKPLLKDRPGVRDGGFIHPPDQPGMMAQCGALLLPSRFEPWGVAVAEACAAGLPVICTHSCGAAVELVRPYYNGLIVGTRDVAGLTRAMRWMHDHPDQLPEMGRRALPLALPYDAPMWAIRIEEACRAAIEQKRN